jgi:hypothetical protein
MNKSRLWRLLSLKANCGWLRPCTLGRFSLFAQRKATKRKGTPWSAPAIAGSLAASLPLGVRIRRIPVPDAHARDPSLAPSGLHVGFTCRSA